MGGAAPLVDVRAVRRIEEHVDPGAEGAEDRGADLRGRPLGAVEDYVQAFEASAVERTRQSLGVPITTGRPHDPPDVSARRTRWRAALADESVELALETRFHVIAELAP